MSRMSRRSCAAVLGLVAALAAPATSMHAQQASSDAADRAAVLALADSALAAISRSDWTALTDLMIPEAVMFPTSTRDGATTVAVRTRAQQRAASTTTRITERGWNGEARVSGGVATVWLPYDLYRDGAWSHCGVDVFTLVRTPAGWRIASMAWSAVQPPACTMHPAGPPAGATPR